MSEEIRKRSGRKVYHIIQQAHRISLETKITHPGLAPVIYLTAIVRLVGDMNKRR